MDGIVGNINRNTENISSMQMELAKVMEIHTKLIGKFSEATKRLEESKKLSSNVFCCVLTKNLTHLLVNIFIWNPSKKLSYIQYRRV
jgi:hypothetical protein